MSKPEKDDQQAILKKFLARRHPDYQSHLAQWRFYQDCYVGGPGWFESNIHRNTKESDDEFNKRIRRAYRFNHTKEVIDQIEKYIFKSPVDRNLDDAYPFVRSFWSRATLGGLTIDEFMWLVGIAGSIYGKVWIFVDSSKSGAVLSIADQKKVDARCYAYIMNPMDVLDVGFDDGGKPIWILVREAHRDDRDPILATGDVDVRYRLWTETSWHVWAIVVQSKDGSEKSIPVEDLPHLSDSQKSATRVVTVAEGVNALGRLPCFPHDHTCGDTRYSASGLINDIAYLDRAIANYLSNLDAIIQDQSFSQLVMPAQALKPGDDQYEMLQQVGTKRIFTYDGESPTAPSYIAPDPKQAGIIVEVINKIIAEIYHTVGMGGERTKQDNAVGIDNSSGVAKAYDFERLNSLLVSKSKSLENAELEIVELVELWNGEAPTRDREDPEASQLVKYADTFDVRSLFDEFTVAERLQLISAPDTLRRQQMIQVVDKLFPALARDIKKKMLAEIDNDWPPAPPELTLTATSAPNGLPAKATQQSKTASGGSGGPGSGGPASNNRQGQVTSKTS